ncbi:MAG: hypothetical protein NC184_07345 [Roseburia sp.]|nr:hypothetical protein [Roseburia sp.]
MPRMVIERLFLSAAVRPFRGTPRSEDVKRNSEEVGGGFAVHFCGGSPGPLDFARGDKTFVLPRTQTTCMSFRPERAIASGAEKSRRFSAALSKEQLLRNVKEAFRLLLERFDASCDMYKSLAAALVFAAAAAAQKNVEQENILAVATLSAAAIMPAAAAA